jgi:hypothetical protein
MAINIHNLRVYNMTVGAGSSGGEGGGGGGGSSTPSYLFIGADRDDDNGTSSGTVYAYDATNYSAAPTKIQPSDAAGAQYFGKSISVAGTTLVIGAEGDNGYAGAFYVYDSSNLSGTPTKVTSPGGSFFGRNVVATANYIAATSSGGVFLYDPSNLSASPTTVTTSNLFSNEDRIAIVGNYLALADGNWNGQRGKVYVYDLSNLSAAPTELTSPTQTLYRRFGQSIAAAGTKLVVGSIDEYKAYVFDSANWSTSPTTLTPFDGLSNDFGNFVGGSADYIIIGARGDDAAATNAGAAYIYDATNLSTQATKLTGVASNDNFGMDMAVFGDSIAIGAPNADIGSNSDQGAVYVYDGTNLSASPTVITAADGAASDEFGRDIKFG